MENIMEDKPQSKFWIVLIVAIISLACITCVVIIVFGTPFANKLADRYFEPDEANDLVLSFDGTFDGADGEMGYGYGLSFVPGHKGKAILFDDEDTLYYASDNNINPQQGVIEFWIKPEWNGNDNQSYVFFEIGDSWFNRFRIIKDGANNFRFMVWSTKIEYDAACDVSSWMANEWHQVRVTWQNDIISINLDGTLCDTQTFVVMPGSLSSRLYIGSSASQDLQAQSVIDEFKIYSQP
jgi:hypothetical protein